MKLLSRVDETVERQIYAQFPQLRQVRENEKHTMPRVAVSVFDHWLRDEQEWNELDCFDGPERQARDKKFQAHWASIFDIVPVYTVRYRGRWPHKVRMVLKRYNDKDGFVRQSRVNPLQAPSQFIVLPDLDCIYAASWDDTNVVYFNSRTRAEPVLELAKAAGLHVLEFDL